MRLEQRSLKSTRLVLDAAALLYIGLLILLTIVFSSKLPGWREALTKLMVAAAMYMVAASIVRLLPLGFASIACHTVAVMILYSFLFQITAQYQHVFVDRWLDGTLIALEKSVVGVESSTYLQRFVSPYLSEWMMFTYVVYVPLLPGIALLCYWSAGPQAASTYLLNFSLANILCYVGFILIPVAGPLCYFPEQFTVPLQGGIFTWCGEWMRGNVHYPGGCLPSPHCALGTVMMLMLHRYSRRSFLVTFPIFLSIYAATVYGRYHYLSDVVTGIIVGVIVVKFSPLVVHAVYRAADIWAAAFRALGIRGSVPQYEKGEKP